MTPRTNLSKCYTIPALPLALKRAALERRLPIRLCERILSCLGWAEGAGAVRP